MTASATNRQWLWPTAIALAVIGSLAALLYFSEWETREVNGGYSEAALRNYFLAGEHFLGHFGVDVVREDGLKLLDDLPDSAHTILIASSRRALSSRRSQNLLEWVEQGGRLILLAQHTSSKSRAGDADPILQEVGVHLYEHDGDDDSSDGQDATIKPKTFRELFDEVAGRDSCARSADVVTSIPLDGEARSVDMVGVDGYYLDFDDELAYGYASNDYGPQLVRAPYGEGSVFVMTSFRLWRNRQIECYGHAHLLRWLTADRPKLWLLSNTELPALPVLIWRNYPLLVLAALLWLVMWVWYSAFRRTAAEPLAVSERRELMEQVTGVARFLFQQKSANTLLAAMRGEVTSDKGLKSMQDERLAAWSDAIGEPREAIYHALNSPVRNANELKQTVDLLRRLLRTQT